MCARVVNPYNIPHDCESDELWRRLQPLTTNQRKVLRSYMRNVEFGDMSLTAWAHDGTVPRVSLATWRKPFSKGGNYWGTEDSPNMLFRDAVAAYVTAMGRWQTEEEEQSVRAANRIIRLGATGSAEYMIALVDNPIAKDTDRLNAAKTILDRASEETASKGSISVHGISIETFAEMEADAEAEADELEEGAIDEWQP